jgi:regulator of RNase E activity RraA
LTGNIISSTGVTVLNSGAGAGTAVYVGSVNGTASNALQLNNKIQDVTAAADTIALRDASGNLVANQFTGTATQADTLLWSGSYRTAASTSTANTVVIRDASSNIYCNVLNGTATSAQYADLAEKYLTDQEYDTGTVVVVGGEKEVTASTWGKRAIGVVSANPAFMMNRDLEGGTYIALKGRVPVKVIGSVKKGDNLIAANDGCASVAVHHSSEVFAVALESNSDTSVKLVEAVIL